MTNLKNTFYVDKEMQVIMNKYYEIKKIFQFDIILPIFSKTIIDTELKISTYTNISTSYPKIFHTLF